MSRTVSHKNKNKTGFGSRLDSLRQHDETKGKFADRLGIHPNSISNYLGGRISDPKVLSRISEVTGASIAWLLTGEGSPYHTTINPEHPAIHTANRGLGPKQEDRKMGIGKAIRLERIMNRQTATTVIVPMDHGVTVGPIPGLIDLAKTVDMVAEGGANAVVEHSGMVGKGHRSYGRDIGLIIHLSGSTSLAPDPNRKVLVCSVERAVRLGADAVSIHINIGAENEGDMFESFGLVAEAADDWGIPLLAMVYPRGPKVKSERDVENVKIAARVGAELGADIVKVPWTGSAASFREVVEGCPVPVVIAGGSKLTDEETLRMVEGAMQAGAAGLSMGRNAFQHESPVRLVAAACAIVHQKKSVEEAMAILNGQIPITSTILIPVPEAKDYLIRTEQKENSEQKNTDAHTRYYNFYIACIEKFKFVIPDKYAEPTGRDHYKMPTQIPSVHFEWHFCPPSGSSLEVGLHFESTKRDVNLSRLEHCLSKKDQLEELLEQEISVQREWKYGSRIYIEKPSRVINEELIDWAVDKMAKMIKFLKPFLSEK
jgi:predicted phospho-2-dehydro-3-deoxyheptonate aldolase